jgi:hypothetical protein
VDIHNKGGKDDLREGKDDSRGAKDDLRGAKDDLRGGVALIPNSCSQSVNVDVTDPASWSSGVELSVMHSMSLAGCTTMQYENSGCQQEMEINAYQMTGDILVVHRHPAALGGFHQMEWHGKMDLVLLWKQSGQCWNE